MQRIGSGRISEGDPGASASRGESREGNVVEEDLFDQSQEKAKAWIARRAEIFQEVEWRAAPQMDLLLFTVCEMIHRLGGSEADTLKIARAFGAAEIETDSLGWHRGYAAGKETMRKIYGPMKVEA
jgi:hypothetical protein